MKFLLTLIFIGVTWTTNAQDNWSLRDCIDYALQNNISLKKSELIVEQRKNREMQSKMQFLPSLQINNSFNQNQGRYINPVTNTIVEEVSNSVNLSLSSNLTLFNGFKNINQLKRDANEHLKSIYDLETAKNNLISTIALSYLQILFNEELFETAVRQSNLTKNQESRIETMVDAGSLPKGELLNIQSQLALEKQNVIQAENQLNLAKLQLAQLLELENYQSLEVEKISVGSLDFNVNINIEKDFKKALKNQPSIKSAELQVDNAIYDYKIAKSTYAPSLHLRHNLSSVYADNAMNNLSFNEQLTNNRQSGLYLNLNIPIFNQWTAQSAVKESKIYIENSKLIAEESKNQLRKNMEQAHADQLAAYKKYLASQKSVKANHESYSYINERYELGMVDSYEFSSAKNQLIQAESDELQAKYDLIFKMKLYEFYTSQTFEL